MINNRFVAAHFYAKHLTKRHLQADERSKHQYWKRCIIGAKAATEYIYRYIYRYRDLYVYIKPTEIAKCRYIYIYTCASIATDAYIYIYVQFCLFFHRLFNCHLCVSAAGACEAIYHHLKKIIMIIDLKNNS